MEQPNKNTQLTLAECLVRMKELMAQTTALSTVEMQNAPTPEMQKTLSLLESMLEKPLHDKLELKVKQILATATAASKAVGTLPENMQKAAETPDALASAVDDSLTRVKGAYLVVKGKMQPEEVADYLIDKGAARLKTVTKAVVAKGAVKAVQAVSKIIEKVFPPAKIVTPFVAKVIAHVSEKASNTISKGIDKVATVAKTVAHKAIDTARKVGNKVKGFLAKIFS